MFQWRREGKDKLLEYFWFVLSVLSVRIISDTAYCRSMAGSWARAWASRCRVSAAVSSHRTSALRSYVGRCRRRRVQAEALLGFCGEALRVGRGAALTARSAAAGGLSSTAPERVGRCGAAWGRVPTGCWQPGRPARCSPGCSLKSWQPVSGPAELRTVGEARGSAPWRCPGMQWALRLRLSDLLDGAALVVNAPRCPYPGSIRSSVAHAALLTVPVPRAGVQGAGAAALSIVLWCSVGCVFLSLLPPLGVPLSLCVGAVSRGKAGPGAPA